MCEHVLKLLVRCWISLQAHTARGHTKVGIQYLQKASKLEPDSKVGTCIPMEQYHASIIVSQSYWFALYNLTNLHIWLNPMRYNSSYSS